MSSPINSSFLAELTSSTFVGREMLLAGLVQMVTRGQLALITLVGPGGVGKTRLALELIRALAPTHPVPITYVPLAQTRSADLFGPVLLEALGIDTGAEQGNALNRCIDWLRQYPALIVLDNLEHILDVRGAIARLVGQCPGLVVVATSRAATGLPAEHVIELPPLDGSLPTDRVDEDASPAVRLFEERARRALPGFRLTRANLAMVAQVCDRLGGLPLAIELAASQSALYSPHDLLRLGDALAPAPDGAVPDEAGRHESMRLAIGWSFDLLTTDARHAAADLAVFPGGFTLDTAFALTGQPPAAVTELLDHHLIQALDGPAGERRFAMLEPIRQYGLDVLYRDGELRRLESRMVEVMRTRANAMAAVPYDEGYSARLAALLPEMPNIRAALTIAMARDDRGAVADIVSALDTYWARYGRVDEALWWLDRILPRFMDPVTDPKMARSQALILRVAGHVRLLCGNFVESSALFDRSCTIARDIGDHVLAGWALLLRGEAATQLRDFPLAWSVLHEARAIADAHDDALLTARSINNLGVVALVAEDLGLAELYLVDALGRVRALGDSSLIASVLHFLGYAMAFRGEFSRGRAYLDECLALHNPAQLRSHSWMTQARTRLELHARQPVAAAPYAISVLELRFRNGDVRLMETALCDVAVALHQSGHHVVAAWILGAAGAANVCSAPETLFNTLTHAAWREGRAALGEQLFFQHYRSGADASLGEVVDLVTLALTDLAPAPPMAADGTRYGLTAREMDILALMAQGKSYREMAGSLFISEHTAKTHGRNVLRKLGVSSRSAAVASALHEGLIHPHR